MRCAGALDRYRRYLFPPRTSWARPNRVLRQPCSGPSLQSSVEVRAPLQSHAFGRACFLNCGVRAHSVSFHDAMLSKRRAPLDLNLLITLQALLELRSVTRAAERLCVAQPSMSRRLAELR